MSDSQPLWKGAAAVFPYSPTLHQQYWRQPKYKNQPAYCLARQDGPHLWVPREAVPGPLDRVVEGRPAKFQLDFTPRNAEQVRVVMEGQALLRAGKSFIMQAPTGFGKTVIGCTLIHHMQRRTMVITTKEDVVEQWTKDAMKILKLDKSRIGFLAGDVEPKPEHDLVIALVQSAMKGPERYPDLDFA